MKDLGECKRCKIQEWTGILEQSGGLCFDCYEELKNIAQDKEEKKQRREEKKQRREESGYHQNTGKYKKR